MKYFSAILFVLVFLVLRAYAHVWTVEKGSGTIRQAIAVAAARDTILVKSGVYHEQNLIIGKMIYLKGIGKPVLEGEKKYEIISIKADGVVVEGFVLQNSGASSLEDIAAIKIYNRRNVQVTGNTLLNNFFGIYVKQCINCTIRNNEVKSFAIKEFQSGDGIHCWKSDRLVINGNELSGHRDGIYFEFVTNSLISRNNSHNNVRYGLHFMFSHNDTYEGNIFRHNGAGASVMYTHGIKMLNNVFTENWGDAAYAILMKDIDDSYVIGNEFVKNTIAIYMEGSNRVRMQKNLFRSNGWALKMQASCSDNIVTGNNFTGNSFDVGTNGSLVLSSFNYNYWDKYEGYDLNRNSIGDVPYRPVGMYSMVVEKNPVTMMLFRSFMVSLLDKAEKVLPSITPENLKDEYPLMKPYKWKFPGIPLPVK
jgi:nitrous oxidase accessory protein